MALASIHLRVEPLPRAIISAAMLKGKSESKISSINENSAHKALEALKGFIPDIMLHSLAPFQMEGVQFVMKNDGRALIADEMGLGIMHLT